MNEATITGGTGETAHGYTTGIECELNRGKNRKKGWPVYQENSIYFETEGRVVLRFNPNGGFFVEDRHVTDDMEIYILMKKWLRQNTKLGEADDVVVVTGLYSRAP